MVTTFQIRKRKIFLINLPLVIVFIWFGVGDHPLSAADKANHDLEDLQKQIHEILKADETVKVKNQAQALEVKRIIDQARMDQEILRKMEEAKGKEGYPTDQTAELLRQEKIRLIREQNIGNWTALQNLNPPPGVSKATSEENATPGSGKKFE